MDEATVIVRYDPEQTAEARITAENGTMVVTFGPTLPTGTRPLDHILRAEVAPADEAVTA